jgi:predicted NUDIX family phosphoesterase
MGKDDEMLVTVPEAVLKACGEFQGVLVGSQAHLNAIFNPKNFVITRRGDAENDPAHKQLVSYVIVEDVNTGKLWSYSRTKKSGEGRLVSKHSIGIGGHINGVDLGGFHISDHITDMTNIVMEAVKRELFEEVKLTGNYTMSFRGILYDGSNEVGTVHLGLICVVKIDGRGVEVNEDHLKDEGFISIDNLKKVEEMESWSKLCLEKMEQLLGWI